MLVQFVLTIMKKHQIKFISASVISALALWSAACSPSGGGSSDGAAQVMRAFPESAELAMYFDQSAISESDFSEAIQDLQEDLPETPENEQAQEFAEQFTEVTGLEDDDVTDFALAISGLENAQMDPSQLKISGGIFATKPVTTEQVVAAVQLIAEQNDEELEMTITTGDGADFIEFPKEPGSPEMHAAVVTGESSTVVFFGDLPSVEASLARSSGSVPAGLEAASKGLIDGQQGWISVVLPDSLKAQLAQTTAQMEAMIPNLSAANSLESVGVGIKTAESLDVAVGFNLGSSDDAVIMEGILNNQLISFAKMMLAGGTPEPLPLLNSLTASQSENRAVLSMVVTIEDIKILQAQLMSFLPSGNMGVTPSAVQ